MLNPHNRTACRSLQMKTVEHSFGSRVSRGGPLARVQCCGVAFLADLTTVESGIQTTVFSSIISCM